MRIRIKFSRKMPVRFIGHLDIMRAFQRCFIRAGVEMIYSTGFSPHQKMNFAQPLGVGALSTGEYLDAEIADGQDLEKVMQAMESQIGPGFDLFGIYELQENAEKCMAAVRYAAYTVNIIEGDTPALTPFEQAEQVITLKRTKSGEKETDIKPFVKNVSQEGGEFKMVLLAGEKNLKPDLLMQEIYRLNGLEYDRSFIKITRTDIFAEGMVPLSQYQTL